MRYSKKFLLARFELTMSALRLDTGATYSKANVGVHFVDYAPHYGGYAIRVMFNEDGAEAFFAGLSERYSAAEFKALLDGLLAADVPKLEDWSDEPLAYEVPTVRRRPQA